MEEGIKDSPPLKRLKISKDMQIRCILPNEYTETAFEDVFICKIQQKKQIGQLMQELSQHLPLHPTLQHLKRVRQSDIILCRRIDVPIGVTINEFLSNTRISKEAFDAICLSVEEVKVPALACRLRCQYDMMRSYWPIKFHPDKKLESLLDGSCFDSEEIEFHRRIVSFLMHLSRDLESNRPCALCVDPRTNSIVSIAASHADVNPIYHATIVLVNLVARTQNPCVLNEIHEKNFIDPLSGAKIVGEKTLAGVIQKYREFNLKNFSYENLKMGAEMVNQKNHKVGNTFEPGVDNLTKYGPYLCTGYDIYLTAEPCLMCAMALVHSRAKRVFFANPSIGNGALLTNLKLQGVKELNHHYDVFHCCNS